MKLEKWNTENTSAMMVIVGMRTFQYTAMELVSASQRTPIVLITAKTSMNPAPIRMPLPSSVPLAVDQVQAGELAS